MSILSDKDIKECNNKGDIVITPFKIKNLGNCSYDVTLGEHYYINSANDIIETNNTKDTTLMKLMSTLYPLKLNCYNPFNPEHVKKYWTYKSAEIVDKELADSYGLLEGSKIIVVPPHETILAHTNEFVGGVNNITTMMEARSSYGRSGISVCKCSGWGDVGYINRWTMEIQNSLNIPVILTVGERIAQIVFIRTGEIEKPYHTKGSYQNSSDINFLMDNWKPETMLPKIKYDQKLE